MWKRVCVLILSLLIVTSVCSCASGQPAASSTPQQDGTLPVSGESADGSLENQAVPENMYVLQTMDLSAPFPARKWEQEQVLLEHAMTGNELLWLLRDRQNGLANAAGIEMGEIIWEETETCTVNFTDPGWTPDDQYLHNLCSTLIQDIPNPGCFHFRFLYQGEPMEQLPLTREGYYRFLYYEPIESAGYYTAEELRELQKQVPMRWVGPKAEQSYQEAVPAKTFLDATGIGGAYPSLMESVEQEQGIPGVLERFFAFMGGDGDPVKGKLSAFLCQALPCDHEIVDYASMHFDTPQDAPNELLVAAGLQHTSDLDELRGVSLPSAGEVDGGSLSPVKIISKVNDVTDRVIYGWLAEHVEQVASYFYGDNLSIVHQGYGNKRYHFGENTQLYGHSPAGIGCPMVLFPVLHYRDLGEQYEVEIALLYGYAGFGGLSLFSVQEDGTQEPIEWECAIEYSRSAAPRAKILINKLADGRLTIQSFHYLGADN